MNPVQLYTVGHSNRSAEELITLLSSNGLDTLVDIRATPFSRRHPQFNQGELGANLSQADMVYHWAGQHLGGRRVPNPNSRHLALEEDGLRGYADHMETPPFRREITKLLELSAENPVAVMCAERDPERCHRSLLADFALLAGAEVIHIIDHEFRRLHVLHPCARLETAELVYDRHIQRELLDA